MFRKMSHQGFGSDTKETTFECMLAIQEPHNGNACAKDWVVVPLVCLRVQFPQWVRTEEVKEPQTKMFFSIITNKKKN